MSQLPPPPTALEQLTGVQADAVRATAAAMLRDPEELAAEWLSLLFIDPAEELGPPLAVDGLTVKDSLTAAEPPAVDRPGDTNPIGIPLQEAETTSYSITFTTAPPRDFP